MDVITTVRAMQDWSDAARRRGQRIGLVPTMGYLHEGHLSLVTEARRRAAVTVASIFVNPLQFGANEDLARYPRDIPRDTRLLTEAGTDVLFLPEVSEMYPEGFQTTVTVERVTQGLCGVSRPTHFRGVTTVVAKLFNMVKPDVAVFGRKDYQQLVAIQRMVRDLNFDIEVIGAPIVREADGLALSSRNAYLSAPERAAALCLSKALHAAQAAVGRGETDAERILATALAPIKTEPLARLDYATLADPETLAEVSAVNGAALLALAAYVGKTRLIDNCILGPREEFRLPQGRGALPVRPERRPVGPESKGTPNA
jgi:pantoate--beta-alanine ligase